MALHALAGSERRPVPGARSIGPADPAEQLEVSVVLRQASAEVLREKVRKLAAGDRSETRVEREDFAGQFGARPEDIEAVGTFAATHGLTVAEADPARRTIVLRRHGRRVQRRLRGGSAAVRASGWRVSRPDRAGASARRIVGRGRGGAGPGQPADRPVACRAAGGQHDMPARTTVPERRHRSARRFSLRCTGFPAGDGQGAVRGHHRTGRRLPHRRSAGIFRRDRDQPGPTVSAVSVDHGMNLPTGDAERTGRRGDARHRGGRRGRPGGADRGVFRAEHRCRVPRRDHHGGARHGQPAVGHLDQLGRPGVVLDAAGDDGVRQCVAVRRGDGHHRLRCRRATTAPATARTDGADHVDFPASSPHVLACGGTSLQAANLAISSEVVWNDGGNGRRRRRRGQRFFALPAWQAGLTVLKAGQAGPLTMRGVPDVSGNADPETGYDVRIDGSEAVLGGTSAVAPLWAGLIAPHQRRERRVGGVHQSVALPQAGRDARCHPGEQRRLRRRRRLGCVHRIWQPQRFRAGGAAGGACGLRRLPPASREACGRRLPVSACGRSVSSPTRYVSPRCHCEAQARSNPPPDERSSARQGIAAALRASRPRRRGGAA